MRLDVVTTAIRRPELLRRTYESFLGIGLLNLPSLRIILNIDPMGSGNPDESIRIAEAYADEVVVNIAPVANFATAVNWAWKQVESPVFLHLEDDWQLRRFIDFSDWLKQLQSIPEACQSVLLRKHARGLNPPFSFRPTLIKRSFIDAAGTIPAQMNPEKYLHQRLMDRAVSVDFGPEYAFFDLGRKWAKGKRLQKVDAVSGSDHISNDQPWFGVRDISVVGVLDYSACQIRWDWSMQCMRLRKAWRGSR